MEIKGYRLMKKTKYKRNHKRHFLSKKNKVYYSISTKCTWREKLPIMHNQNYMLLYGIYPAVCNIELENFKKSYEDSPFELYVAESAEHINRLGNMITNNEYKDISKGTVGFSEVGIIIKKKVKMLDTTKIADRVYGEFKKGNIKHSRDEVDYIRNECKLKGYTVFSFPAKYENIDTNLYTAKLIKPASYIIVNPNIIVDVAIGIENIGNMVNQYNNLNKDTTIEKSILQEADKKRTAKEAKDAIEKNGIFNGFKR